MAKHASSLKIVDSPVEDDSALKITCTCGWAMGFPTSYDRYAGYQLPITLEELWARWMVHLANGSP